MNENREGLADICSLNDLVTGDTSLLTEINTSYCVIVRVRVVLKRTVVGD